MATLEGFRDWVQDSPKNSPFGVCHLNTEQASASFCVGLPFCQVEYRSVVGFQTDLQCAVLVVYWYFVGGLEADLEINRSIYLCEFRDEYVEPCFCGARKPASKVLSSLTVRKNWISWCFGSKTPALILLKHF